MKLIKDYNRKARKDHVCDYCGGIIKRGEIYRYAMLESEKLYEWKSHTICDFIADALRDYVDPYEGMTSDDFDWVCSGFCSTFICPDCNNLDEDCCKEDLWYCVDKIYAYLQTHTFKESKPGVYICVPKETN